MSDYRTDPTLYDDKRLPPTRVMKVYTKLMEPARMVAICAEALTPNEHALVWRTLPENERHAYLNGIPEPVADIVVTLTAQQARAG